MTAAGFSFTNRARQAMFSSVLDPQLRLDELEHVQNEVAELLRGAAKDDSI